MATPKRTEITIETFRRTVIRSRRTDEYVYCRHCESLTIPLTLSEAAAVFEKDAGAIALGLKSGRYHMVDHEGRTLRICSTGSSEQPKTQQGDKQ